MTDENHLSQKNRIYLQRGAYVLVVGIVGGYVLDYAFNLMLSRMLEPDEYGDFKVAYAFAFTCSVMVLLGGDRAAPRFLSMLLLQGDTAEVWEYLRLFLRIGLLLSILLIIGTLRASMMQIGPVDLENHHPLFNISFVVPLLAIGALLSRILQSAKRLAASNLPWRIGLPTLCMLFVLIVRLTLGPITLIQVVVACGVAVVIVCLGQWVYIRRLKLIQLARRPASFELGPTLKVSLPMMLAMLIGVSMSQIDLFMIEAMGTERPVGHYAASAVTVHMVMLVQVTVTGLFAPLISPAIESGKEPARQLYWHAERLIALIAIPIAIVIFFLSPYLLQLFGPSYIDATFALRILTIGYLVWALGALSSTWLQYSSNGGIVVVISFVIMCMNILVNYLLIPRYGIDGAAIATTSSMIVAAGSFIFAHERLWRASEAAGQTTP